MNLYDSTLDLEDLVIKHDRQTGLIAIIALHNLKNGPALGGCRFVHYASVDAAILDAMRLAKAMTYKSAMAGLPLGGGKAVIVGHERIGDRKNLFEKFGDFVDSLRGRYITASDSGTNEADMKIVATRTKHVTSINRSTELIDDTAAMTAAGMLKALEASVAHRFNQNNLKDIHVAIQGVGNVGYLLGKLLLERGARLTIADKNPTVIQQRAAELNAEVVSAEAIMSVKCDVLSPCALGGVLNAESIAQIQAPIVCGAANNQLKTVADGEALRQKDILYVPDYVANAGGVICAAGQAGVISREETNNKIDNIYQSVLAVLRGAQDALMPTNLIADKIAEQRFS